MFGYSGIEKRRAGGAGVVLLVTASILLLSMESKADSGLYLGAGIGSAGIEIDVGTPVVPMSFDESDFAWKGFAGYNFDLPVVNLAIEGGYANLGGPSGDVLGSAVEVEADGITAYGVIGFDLGPLGVFGKYGVISWDAQGSIDGLGFSDDGSDPAYGIGAEIGLSSVAIRAEYEIFDIEDSADISMVSASIVWTF
jgi:hypothetical protein